MSIADFSSHNTVEPERDRVRVTGKTAFILGNGPSLSQINLPLLSPYATIGLNAAYRHWRRIEWRPRYYACLDTVVGLSHKDAIAELIEEGRIVRFLLRDNLIEALGAAGRNPRVVSFEDLCEQAPELAVAPITTGSHAALWAANMGYDQIVLLGVDVNYTEVVAGAARRDGIELEIVRAGANPNYYFEDYQAPGDRFHLPNPRPGLHVNTWKRAAQTLSMAQVSTFNGNKSSGVKCFPFIDLDPFLREGDTPAPATESAKIADEDGGADLSARTRRREFVRAYAGVGALAGCALAAGFILIAMALKLSPLTAAISFAALAVLFLIAAAAVYARFAILMHLHRTDEEVKALRAQLAYIERQLSNRVR